MIDEITEEVIKRIKQKYLLVEKTFNLSPDNNDFDIKTRTFIENVINIVCQFYKVEKPYFQSGAHVNGSFKRAAMCYTAICRELPEDPVSYSRIGFPMKKDHATMMNLYKRHKEKFDKDFEFRIEYNELKKQVEESLKL